MKKLVIFVFLLLCLPLSSLFAFEFLYKNEKGHYHYRCNDAGYIDYLVITFRENGILINSKKQGVVLKRQKLANHIKNAHVLAKAFCMENPGTQPMVIEQ